MTTDTSQYRFIPGVSKVTWDGDLDETPVYIDGRRYTEADAEADADRAEQMLRDGLVPGLIPGGKSLSGGGKHSPVVRVVLSEDTLAQVKARATQSHMSVSKYLRRMIEASLAE
ncbi:MAG: DNA-binding protein [Propionibacteriaceae bacterium]|jgi:predicted DNA binding CopG/RHH family protein|nr:DNA-binding protein [Propionibacteriaceae bacterium]